MTNQEFFTKCVTHVLSQKERSATPSGMCVYAGPNDNACAVGCVLPRELAIRADRHPDLQEDASIAVVLKAIPAIAQLLDGVSPKLLRKCQRTHDNATGRSPEQIRVLRDHFSQIAEDFDLEMPNV